MSRDKQKFLDRIPNWLFALVLSILSLVIFIFIGEKTNGYEDSICKGEPIIMKYKLYCESLDRE